MPLKQRTVFCLPTYFRIITLSFSFNMNLICECHYFLLFVFCFKFEFGFFQISIALFVNRLFLLLFFRESHFQYIYSLGFSVFSCYIEIRKSQDALYWECIGHEAFAVQCTPSSERLCTDEKAAPFLLFVFFLFFCAMEIWSFVSKVIWMIFDWIIFLLSKRNDWNLLGNDLFYFQWYFRFFRNYFRAK